MITRVLSFIFFTGTLFGQTYEESSIFIQKNSTRISIDPNTRLKINGKDARYDGLDIENKILKFTMMEDGEFSIYPLNEINKIHLPKKGWFLSQLIEHASIGFKKGLYVSKILSVGSIYLIQDRENNDYEEITETEYKFISVLMLTPIFGGLVGGIVGMIDPTPVYDDPLILEQGGWTIIN